MIFDLFTEQALLKLTGLEVHNLKAVEDYQSPEEADYKLKVTTFHNYRNRDISAKRLVLIEGNRIPTNSNVIKVLLTKLAQVWAPHEKDILEHGITYQSIENVLQQIRFSSSAWNRSDCFDYSNSARDGLPYIGICARASVINGIVDYDYFDIRLFSFKDYTDTFNFPESEK